MIKLISQFDNEKTRLSLATPTCGGCCCCCCCCLVSTITTSCISARSFGKMVKKDFPEDDKKIKSAKLVGFLWPIIGLVGIIASFIIVISSIENFDEILPPLSSFEKDIIYTTIIYSVPILVFIISQVICIKKLRAITDKKYNGISTIVFSIIWVISFIIEAIICFLILVNM